MDAKSTKYLHQKDKEHKQKRANYCDTRRSKHLYQIDEECKQERVKYCDAQRENTYINK